MITTVTFNPCIDYTMYFSSLEAGELNIASGTRFDAGGKGINVGIVLSELGENALCTGLSFEQNHSLIASRLDSLGVAHDFVLAPGSIRTNVKAFNTTENELTELNCKGDLVDEKYIQDVFDKVAALSANSEYVVISGRIPNGAKTDIYRKLTSLIKSKGAKVILDAEKEPLKEAIKEKPYLIKPNLYELEHTFGRKAQSVTEVLSVCGWIISMGVEVVCVSMGSKGALIADKNDAYYAEALTVEVKGLPGAGDSMVAGICSAICSGGDISYMLRNGIAASAGSVMREGTQFCTRADFQSLLGKVKIQKLQTR